MRKATRAKRAVRVGTGRRAASAATPWLVLGASLALTLAMTLFLWLGVRVREQAAFRNVVQTTNDRITARLDVYVAMLRGAAGLFMSADTVTPAMFSAWVERLELERWYPGIQGIGWTRRVAYDPAAPVDEIQEIAYIEPLDERNRAALGFDMYAEPVRRAAMRTARDSGMPAVTGVVTLVQEIIGPQQAGFLIYLPVFEEPAPETVAERRGRLRGFVYSAFRADDLFAGIFGTERRPRLSFRVYAGETPDATHLLHASPVTAGHRPRLREVSRILVLNRAWTVVHASEPAFEASTAPYMVPIALVAGLVASGWLFWLARGQTRARLAAEDANRAKSAFLAMMSHELRTPLNAISGYAELIEIGVAGETTDRQRDYLLRIRRAQRHLLGLINDILHFAKIDAGRASIHPAAVAIGAIVKEADQLMAEQARAKGLEYRSEGGPPVSVWADPDRVRQALLNLLSNAVKFTDPGGSVHTHWVANGREVHVTVEDTGPGIPVDQHERIFDPFVQADGDLTRVKQGTGLGLAIARELARAMDGDVRLDSEPGRGSRFILVLPLAPPPAAGPSVAEDGPCSRPSVLDPGTGHRKA